MCASHSKIPFVRDDGCLVLQETVVKPWPSLRMRPEIRPGQMADLLGSNRESEVWRFVERIPVAVMILVRAVPNPRWTLLEMAAEKFDRCEELLGRIPALAVLLSETFSRGDDRRGRMAQTLAKRWRQMLPLVGLPSEERYVRMLRKIPPSHCTRQTLAALSAAVEAGHPHLRLLSHVPAITRDTVALLRKPPERVNAHLLLASCTSDSDEEPMANCVSSVHWFREMKSPGGRWPYGHLDAAALMRVEQRFLECYPLDPIDETPFPPPPFSGVPGKIEPLSDSVLVSAEGMQQFNCAETFVDAIQRGSAYLYAVTIAERATLALEKAPSGHWIIGELRSASNGDVSAETHKYIRAWLLSNEPTLG